ncbi:hypothetical protein [Acinetobacter sp. WZC-1]|uniref:hypothetical protein n=1 Tax=Acinetobacter sp. WZC-1 TaxID=3459034 RepID=UPI00403DDCE9
MKKPGKLLAPIVIAGITVGFLVSAYKFVFARPKSSEQSAPAPRQLPAQLEEKKTN